MRDRDAGGGRLAPLLIKLLKMERKEISNRKRKRKQNQKKMNVGVNGWIQDGCTFDHCQVRLLLKVSGRSKRFCWRYLGENRKDDKKRLDWRRTKEGKKADELSMDGNGWEKEKKEWK